MKATRWARWVLSHRWVVIVGWLLVAVAGGVTAGRTVASLTYDFALPGQPASEANDRIRAVYGGGGVDDPLVLVVRGDKGAFTTPAGVRSVSATAAAVAGAAPGTRVVTPANSNASSLVSADGRLAVALLYPRVVEGPDSYASALPAIQAAAASTRVDGSAVELTSTGLLAESGGQDRGILPEIVLGGAGALVVLVLVFASLLAAVPLLVAVVSILGTFLALGGLAALTDVSFVVQYLVALIGLGVAIDYSLLLVMRWREERSRGAANQDAVLTAMLTAGRSVMFSGVTVAVSLAALVAVPLPFLRSIGLGGLLIPLLSVAVSLTLVPVLLSLAGPALLWPHRASADPTSRRWAAVARWVVDRPWPVIVGSTVLLLAMTGPLVGLRLGAPLVTSYETASTQGRAAAAMLGSGLTPSLLRPTQVLTPAASAPTVLTRLAQVPGVTATGVRDDGWTRDGTTLLQVYTDADPATDAAKASLARVRAVAAEAAGTGPLAVVGGSPAEDVDFVRAVYGRAPVVLGIIILVTFVLLARALRSVWLPVKALALNTLSVGAAYGLTALIWQHGVGTQALFGLHAPGSLTSWVPVAVFAFLFGLSMDYEVFILSRMREAYDEHSDTPQAVVDGIARTGRLVTSGALILFLAFLALSTVPVVDVKILATALALGIAIDALLVRSLLAPALVTVLGKANWTMPQRLGRLLRL